MKNNYDVNIGFIFDKGCTSPENELATQLNIKSEQIIRHNRVKDILCCVKSNCLKNEPIDKHLISLLSKLEYSNPISMKKIKQCRKINLEIGVFYYTSYCVLKFPGKILNKFYSKLPDINLSLSCYPCED